MLIALTGPCFVESMGPSPRVTRERAPSARPRCPTASYLKTSVVERYAIQTLFSLTRLGAVLTVAGAAVFLNTLGAFAYTSGSTGFDIGYLQCGTSYPTGSFGIVGNDSAWPFNSSLHPGKPCLAFPRSTRAPHAWPRRTPGPTRLGCTSTPVSIRATRTPTTQPQAALRTQRPSLGRRARRPPGRRAAVRPKRTSAMSQASASATLRAGGWTWKRLTAGAVSPALIAPTSRSIGTRSRV